MNSENLIIEQKRRRLVQQALDEILNVSVSSDFYQNAFYVIAKFGLQLKAKEESLFDRDEWAKSENKDDLIKRIENFLTKYIR